MGSFGIDDFILSIQASLVIRGGYVPVFWAANTEFVDKKTHFD
jgi:hypothetical protein